MTENRNSKMNLEQERRIAELRARALRRRRPFWWLLVVSVFCSLSTIANH